MTRFVTPQGVFNQVIPGSEKEFEDAVVANTGAIFGSGRYYIDCKRRVGTKGKKQNVADGYLLDFRRNEARLFVVENELATHDAFSHIGVQLLGFSYSHDLAARQLKAVLFEEVCKRPEILVACESYAKERGYRNVDNLLDYLVHESPFQAVVLIDELTDELNAVIKRLKFPVEIIEFVMFEDETGARAYKFEPFLEGVEDAVGAAGTVGQDIGELDTIVVPAREDGFRETFLGEQRWYSIRLHSSMIPQIKHIAAYQVAPTSAITSVAPVREIYLWQDTGKYCLEFAQPARDIGPIPLAGAAKGKAPQGPRYASLKKLLAAKNLADVW